MLIVETHERLGLRERRASTPRTSRATDRVTLLPEDPDASARRIRARAPRRRPASRPAVVIADSFGRAWRLGQADVAIGCAGLTRSTTGAAAATATAASWPRRRSPIADQVAAAADLARDKDAGVPACLVRGLGRFVTRRRRARGARRIRRPAGEDLFR